MLKYVNSKPLSDKLHLGLKREPDIPNWYGFITSNSMEFDGFLGYLNKFPQCTQTLGLQERTKMPRF